MRGVAGAQMRMVRFLLARCSELRATGGHGVYGLRRIHAYVVRDMPERMDTSDHLYVADQFFGFAGSAGPS